MKQPRSQNSILIFARVPLRQLRRSLCIETATLHRIKSWEHRLVSSPIVQEWEMDDMLTLKRALNLYFLSFTSSSINFSHLFRLIGVVLARNFRYRDEHGMLGIPTGHVLSFGSCGPIHVIGAAIERKATRVGSRDSDRDASNNKSPL